MTAVLEDEIEFDPEQTKLLLAALKQQHTSHIASFQKTVANTRSVCSKVRVSLAALGNSSSLMSRRDPFTHHPANVNGSRRSDSNGCGTIYSSDSASDGNGSDESSSPETMAAIR